MVNENVTPVLKKISLSFVSLLCLCLNMQGQITSSHDGFYNTDSLFYQLSGSDSFKFCVNCYISDSLHLYRGGVWLYSREHAANTWENGNFYNEKEGHSDHIRPDVVKGNSIWVRTYKNGKYTDGHHFVFLGHWKPKTSIAVSIFIDSADLIGPEGFYGAGTSKTRQHPENYLCTFEKICSYQVFGGKDFRLEAGQTAGIELGGMQSRGLANKTLQLNANLATGEKKMLSLGKSLSDSIGTDIKVIRFRVGGASYHGNILSNEIATAIINPEIGGTTSTPVCIFVNGSFWTYGLAEENLGLQQISKALKAQAKQIVSTRVQSTVATEEAIAEARNEGLNVTRIGKSVIAVTTYRMSRLFYSCFDTIQFEVDTASSSYSPSAYNEICDIVKNGNYNRLAESINRQSFFRYALSVWFFHNSDAWGNTHLAIAKSDTKPWELIADHYDFLPLSAGDIDFDRYFTLYHLPVRDGSRQTLPWHATQRLMQKDPDYFCLLVQDELNTTYKPERTIAIAQNKISLLRPCISECRNAWGANGWIDSSAWENSVAEVVPYLKQRPMAIAAALPKFFFSGKDTSLTIKDMQDVKIKFNAVPNGSGSIVQLNTLELRADFSGKYYPKPSLQIALKYDSSKYRFEGWLEYPDTGATFRVSANKPLIITPVLSTKGSSQEIINFLWLKYYRCKTLIAILIFFLGIGICISPYIKQELPKK